MTSADANGVLSEDPISRALSWCVDRGIAIVPALEPLRRVAETLARFASVGAACSVLYAAIVAGAVSVVHLRPNLSAGIAYAAVIPFNFLMHRHFTFRSKGTVRHDVVRYVAAQSASMAFSIGVMALSVDVLGLPYAVGILGAIVLVPILSYLVLDRWVFENNTLA